ncbi:MAG: hypothetical protein U9R75_00465 [Candidatus Thermoplasmatota archaeon]|nr:hypothetical protein [Candidatus Thermoplasmatota archaeon]
MIDKFGMVFSKTDLKQMRQLDQYDKNQIIGSTSIPSIIPQKGNTPYDPFPSFNQNLEVLGYGV